MNSKHLWHTILVLLICFGILPNAWAETTKPVGAAGDTLVVVKQVVGTDSSGKDQVLYEEQSGRIYRWDNIEQAVLDLSSRGIRQKGVYHKLRAVLDHTVYVIDSHHGPRPEHIDRTGISKVVELKVDNLMVSKDNVTAIYINNCRESRLEREL